MPFDMSPQSVGSVFFVSLVETAGLIAIWTALSLRRQWLRFAGFWALPIALWLAAAPELAGHVLLAMVAITGLVAAFRFVDQAPLGRTNAGLPRVRFTLGTLFYATFLAALICGAVSILAPHFSRRYPAQTHHWIVEDISLAMPIVGGALFARLEGAWIKRLAVLLAPCLTGSAGWYMVSLRADKSGHFREWQLTFDLWGMAFVMCALAGVTAVILWTSRRSRQDTPPTGRVSAGRISVSQVALIALLALPVAYMYYELVRPFRLQGDLPNPNGYDELVAIGEELDSRSMSEEEHDELLHRAREALAIPAIVRLGHYQPKALHLLAVELISAGQAAASAGNVDAALSIYLDVLTLSDRAQRGGVTYPVHFGENIEGMALAELERIAPKLSREQATIAVARLLGYDDEREPIDQLIERDELHAIATSGWTGRWLATVDAVHAALFDHTAIVPGQSLRRDRWRDEARVRVIACDLAIQSFWRQHNRLPSSLSELVPEFLPRIPADPEHHRSIKFTLEAADEYSLSTLDGPGEMPEWRGHKLGRK